MTPRVVAAIGLALIPVASGAGTVGCHGCTDPLVVPGSLFEDTPAPAAMGLFEDERWHAPRRDGEPGPITRITYVLERPRPLPLHMPPIAKAPTPGAWLGLASAVGCLILLRRRGVA